MITEEQFAAIKRLIVSENCMRRKYNKRSKIFCQGVFKGVLSDLQ